ncbi:MAG TPA: hypothetical protein VHU90_00330 [Galbitalea sp.]|nr:hypothetical protein [Galbitalea sp.]
MVSTKGGMRPLADIEVAAAIAALNERPGKRLVAPLGGTGPGRGF